MSERLYEHDHTSSTSEGQLLDKTGYNHKSIKKLYECINVICLKKSSLAGFQLSELAVFDLIRQLQIATRRSEIGGQKVF